MTVLFVALVVFGVYLSLYVAYQTLLFVANALIREPLERAPSRLRRINIVIPAHNEELHLPRLLESATTQDYPADRFRVTVVADNCTDRTVEACRAFNVDVLERHDATNRGKGHAISWALTQIALDQFDALVIVDGDSLVGRDFLRELNLQMDLGDEVIQCFNGVANPGQSWFTRLMDVSRTIANEIIHPGKRKLGLSSHLMGNGMCFGTGVLREEGWNAFSVAEDWEYYARLVETGRHVGYSRRARVYHQESVSLQQASSQRLRWSSGRFAVLGRYGPRLLLLGIRHRDLRCLDAALPLAFPNPSLGMNLTILGLGAALAYSFVGEGIPVVVWFAALALAQLIMFAIGVLYTHDRVASAASLVLAPLFLAWKLGIDVLSLAGVGRDEWKRTHRRTP
jgi:cellulose synthase/poly-beta-1,6-N-acetylglucosamine synthase-like glycosyltransferase